MHYIMNVERILHNWRKFVPYWIRNFIHLVRAETKLRMRVLTLPSHKLKFLSDDVYCRDGFITIHETHFTSNKLLIQSLRKSMNGLEKVFLNRGFPRWKDLDELAYRAHIVTWSASQVRRLPGSFVECGVAFGTLSLTLLKYFENDPTCIKKMYLFDCWEPLRGHELEMIFPIDTDLDYFEYVKQRFNEHHNVQFIKGMIPSSLSSFPSSEQVKFLSIDMNDGDAELAALEFFWPKIVKGGVVYFDDFGWGYPKLVENVHKFMSKNCPESELLHFASGQSILVKSSN